MQDKKISYTPPPGSAQQLCELCGMQVWMGPKQQQKKSEEPMAAIMCTICSIKALRMLRPEDSISELLKKTGHLGGASGRYFEDDKEITVTPLDDEN